MPLSRIVENLRVFISKQVVHRAEDRPADICLKMSFTWWRQKLKILNFSFFWRHVKTKNNFLKTKNKPLAEWKHVTLFDKTETTHFVTLWSSQRTYHLLLIAPLSVNLPGCSSCVTCTHSTINILLKITTKNWVQQQKWKSSNRELNSNLYGNFFYYWPWLPLKGSIGTHVYWSWWRRN